MEENNNSLNTGSKGVFPGNNVPTQGTIKAGPPIQTEQPVKDTTIAPVTPAVQQDTVAEALKSVGHTVVENAKTYFRLETKNAQGELSGIIEIDLISFREKGQESRYLSINTTGAGPDGNQSSTTIPIENEADFNKFKAFISELSWND